MDPHPMLTRETVTREMKAGTEDPHPMPTSRRGVLKSRNDIVPGRSRKYQPCLNFRRQSHTKLKALISRLSEPIYRSSTSSNVSERGSSQVGTPGTLRTMESQPMVEVMNSRTLLSRVSDSGPSLLSRMTDLPSERLTPVLSRGLSAMGYLPSLSPSLQQTQAILESFSRDPKFTKTSLLNSSRLPHFPDSEWTNLIAGKVINLDHVLAAQYSVTLDERRTERIGDLEFIVRSAEPARVVDSHGKWVIAWDPTVDATSYVFPHRSSELRDYGRYISQLFACFPDSLHTRVIQLDRAVRIRVSQRRDLLLTDYNQFSDLHVLWIQNAGTKGKSGESEKRGRSGIRCARRK